MQRRNLLADFEAKLSRLFSLQEGVIPATEALVGGGTVINQLPADSALVEVKQCVRVYDTTVYVCTVLNFTSPPLSREIAVVTGKGGAKEGLRVLLRSPRQLERNFEYLGLPLVVAQRVEEVKRGAEYAIKISA